MFMTIWQGLQRSSRVALVAGIAVIVAGTLTVALFVFGTDYDVLFASLSPQDAAAMTSELDHMKVPYRLGGDGTTILVDRNTVHATRLKLMGKDLPLHGAVGFELFNNSDFGMTEFAQKINYQRALQGEITRTILSLSEIESARVHLAFPEESLFKREQAKAKASISLALRRGQSLRADQVSGIQRLVSAAVTGIAPADVTIVNQEGVALTRATQGEAGSDVAPRLELKVEIEQALVRKVVAILERSFGEGRVMASVDVVLDMNQVRITTEDVRGQANKPGESTTGVIVRERETLRDESALASVRDNAAGSSFRETEYQVGRRVEQVITQPGSIQRIQVVAVVRDPLDALQLAQLKALIGAAVGTAPERGDTVVVHSIGAFGSSSGEIPMSDPASRGADDARPVAGPGPESFEAKGRPSTDLDRLIALAVIGVAASVLILGLIWNRLAASRRRPKGGGRLRPDERDAALAKLRRWMGDAAPVAAPGEQP